MRVVQVNPKTDWTSANMNGNIWMAASDGDAEAVRAFLAGGGDVNTKDEFGYTPL